MANEKLIELIRKADKEDNESLTQDVHYTFMADHLIANGVTIPVRCKDCKYCALGYIRSYLGWCSKWKALVTYSGFCHKGERRPAP